MKSGDEVRCCGQDFMYVDCADDPPPIPERAWPDPSFQVDGDWQGTECPTCGRDLTKMAESRR